MAMTREREREKESANINILVKRNKMKRKSIQLEADRIFSVHSSGYKRTSYAESNARTSLKTGNYY